MPDTMIERVARAIAGQVAFRDWSQMAKNRADLRARIRDQFSLFDANEPTRADCRDAAIEVLEVLREPTEAMLERAEAIEHAPWHSGWSAMLSAAIEESLPPSDDERNAG